MTSQGEDKGVFSKAERLPRGGLTGGGSPKKTVGDMGANHTVFGGCRGGQESQERGSNKINKDKKTQKIPPLDYGVLGGSRRCVTKL